MRSRWEFTPSNDYTSIPGERDSTLTRGASKARKYLPRLRFGLEIVGWDKLAQPAPAHHGSALGANFDEPLIIPGSAPRIQR